MHICAHVCVVCLFIYANIDASFIPMNMELNIINCLLYIYVCMYTCM